MERETGIEPATNGLGSRDSTTELLPLKSGKTHFSRRFSAMSPAWRQKPSSQPGKARSWGPKLPDCHQLLFPRVGLSCFRSQALPPARSPFNNPHLLPIVGKFLAAVEAGHVRACKGSSLREPLTGPFGNRKAKVLVRATKENIEQIRHISPPHPIQGPGKPDRRKLTA